MTTLTKTRIAIVTVLVGKDLRGHPNFQNHAPLIPKFEKSSLHGSIDPPAVRKVPLLSLALWSFQSCLLIYPRWQGLEAAKSGTVRMYEPWLVSMLPLFASQSRCTVVDCRCRNAAVGDRVWTERIRQEGQIGPKNPMTNVHRNPAQPTTTLSAPASFLDWSCVPRSPRFRPNFLFSPLKRRWWLLSRSAGATYLLLSIHDNQTSPDAFIGVHLPRLTTNRGRHI